MPDDIVYWYLVPAGNGKLWEEAERDEALRVLIEAREGIVVWAATDEARELCFVASPPNARKWAKEDLTEAEKCLARMLSTRPRYIVTDDLGHEVFATDNEDRALNHLIVSGRIDIVVAEPDGNVLARKAVLLPKTSENVLTRKFAAETFYNTLSAVSRAVREQIIPPTQHIDPEDLARCD